MRRRPVIETLRALSDTNTVGWDLKVPDVMRAAEFIRQVLRQFETNGGCPSLLILFLPNDHTGGTRRLYPLPGAQVADTTWLWAGWSRRSTHSRFLAGDLPVRNRGRSGRRLGSRQPHVGWRKPCGKGNSHRSPKSAKAIVWLRVSSLLA